MSPRLVLATFLLAACTDPLAALTRVTAEPAGAHCPDGGSAIATGLDLDGDGALADVEIDDVRYQCVTAPPVVPVLVREDELAPDNVCADGGTSVRVGHDTNGNGQLDDPEIEHTTVVCSNDEIFEGDLEIDVSITDVDALRDLRVITGSLTIIDRTAGPSTGTITVSLPALEVVGKQLAMGNAGADLPMLTAVGGDLSLIGTKEVAVPRLASVGGSLELSYGDLVAFEAPVLTTIGDALRAINARHLATIDLPALTAIGHDVTIDGATALTALSAPALTRIGGSLQVTSTYALTSLGAHGELDALREIGGAVTMHFDEALEGVAFPALETVNGPIAIRHSDAIRRVDLPALIWAPDTIIESGALAHVGLGAVVHAGALTISGIRTLTPVVSGVLVEVDLGALRDARSLTLSGFGAVDALALPQLKEVTGELQLVWLGELAAIRLAGLQQAGRIVIQGGQLAELDVAPTAYVGDMILAQLDLTAATSITLPSVQGFLQYAVNTGPDLRALGSLHAISRLIVENNAELVDLSGLDPALAIDSLEVSFNPALTSLRGLDGVTSLRGHLEIRFNPQLASLDLASLTSVGGAIDIDYDDVLPASEVAALLARVGR